MSFHTIDITGINYSSGNKEQHLLSDKEYNVMQRFLGILHKRITACQLFTYSLFSLQEN